MWSASSPARGGLVIAPPRFHPAFAFGRVLFFPERRARLEIVHDELAGRESFAAVRTGDDDQHDLIGGLELADAMDHQYVVQIPARRRFVANLRERFFRHAWIVLEGHGGN